MCLSHPRLLPVPLALTLALSLPGHLQAQTSVEAVRPISIQIAAQPLGSALNELSAATGTPIGFAPALVNNKSAPAVQGSLTVRQAVEQLLLGSGLLAERQGNSLVIKAAKSAQDVTTLSPVMIAARRDASSEGSDSLTSSIVSINKGNQAIKDIPQSISVLTRKQLDEQNITDLRDAANSVTGVVGAKGVGSGLVITARGFQIDSWQYDGVAIPRNHYSLGNWGTEGMVFYDRMEILRGASGLLQGTGSPGGAVNLVRKRGQAEKTIAITARAGTWDRYGLQLDAGGPLNEEGTLRGRVVVDDSRAHSFVDYENNRSRSLYAALDYDFSPDTTFGIGVSHLNSHARPFVNGVPLHADGSDVGLSRSTFTGSWWNHARVDQTIWYADLTHRFNADWSLKASALHMSEKNSSTHQRVQGDVAPNGSGITYADWITDFDSTRTGLDVYVNGQFEALGTNHDITVGTNYSKYKSDDNWTRLFTPGGNLFNLQHHRPEPTRAGMMAAGGRQSLSTYDVEQKGIYASWRVQVTEPLTLIMGARASWYDYLYDQPLINSVSTMKTKHEITPYLGVVYALTPQWSAYGSYTSVFEPQSSRNVEGQLLDPVIGENYELGIKGELLDGRVNTSLAVFRYDHKNRAVNDMASGYACDDWYCSIATGKVRSQGVEAEISGEVLPRLQLMAGYSYNTSKYLRDPSNEGKVFSTWTPKHQFRMWASYKLPGQWNRLSVAGGLITQTHTLNTMDDRRTFTIPGYTVWNARLGYQATPELDLALNINNIFDKRYVISGYTGYNGATYGEPRNVMLTLKYALK